jgi:hypothetical protein
MFIFSTSKQPPQSIPPTPESRSDVPNSHQNPRQLAIAPTATNHVSPTTGHSSRHRQIGHLTTILHQQTPAAQQIC